jgi:hypothetical protein
VKARLMRLLRLAERPEPPPGSGSTLDVFRASPRLFQLKAARWALRHAVALAGIVFSFAFLAVVEQASGGTLHEVVARLGERIFHLDGPEFAARFTDEVWSVVRALELVAVAFFVVELAVSWLLLRLDWEARWYMVSDESLRIREGLFRTHERTMTVANIQNLSIRRGPLQKLLGIADLEVRTAGGGKSSSDQPGSSGTDLHVGRFRGIENATALRDRIEASLRRHRDTGLGDPDDAHPDPPTAAGAAATSGVGYPPPVVAAAEALRREAGALRAAAEALAKP